MILDPILFKLKIKCQHNLKQQLLNRIIDNTTRVLFSPIDSLIHFKLSDTSRAPPTLQVLCRKPSRCKHNHLPKLKLVNRTATINVCESLYTSVCLSLLYAKTAGRICMKYYTSRL